MPAREHLAGMIRRHNRYHRRHHDGRGFKNIWDAPDDAPFFRVMGWMLGRAIRRKQNLAAPSVPPDLSAIRHPAEHPRLTWIGHSSFLLQVRGLNILLDPVFADRASPLPFVGPKRESPLPFQITDLPAIDLVIVSHDHYDHLDRNAVAMLEDHSSPLFLVPLGVGSPVRKFGAMNVTEMDWWQELSFGGAIIHSLPARHFSGRGLHNRNGTLWSSWYLVFNDFRLYFAGDSGYASHFREIGQSIGPPDVALMPIGAYLPRWIMEPVHVSPEEALTAFRDLGAATFVSTHWGTFDLADEPTHEPMERLMKVAAEQGLEDRILPLRIGETTPLPTLTPANQETSARSDSS